MKVRKPSKDFVKMAKSTGQAEPFKVQIDNIFCKRLKGSKKRFKELVAHGKTIKETDAKIKSLWNIDGTLYFRKEAGANIEVFANRVIIARSYDDYICCAFYKEINKMLRIDKDAKLLFGGHTRPFSRINSIETKKAIRYASMGALALGIFDR